MGVELFVSNRGTPAIIWSDNATNFVRAVKELRNNIENWNTINIAAELAHKGIKLEVQSAQITTSRWHLGEAGTYF